MRNMKYALNDVQGFFMKKNDLVYMQRAFDLAVQGRGWVNPNPLVGAVIVKDGSIVGEGWHERYGELHAERNALMDSNTKGIDVSGATMYVTLEPCCHYGKTPPCIEAIIENNIARVVVGLLDPNPLVAGKGIEQLRDAGIEVEQGLMEEQLLEQNKIFIKYITQKRPWVVMKTAMSLDGKIATHTGDSKWITGDAARAYVQKMRASYMAIMVGRGTVQTDNPMLNCRLGEDIRQPIRLVVDSGANIDVNSKIVQTANEFRTIILHTDLAVSERLVVLNSLGVETMLCKSRSNKVDIDDMLDRLGTLHVDSILLEGGGELNEAFMQANCIDEIYAFIAPKLIGGARALTPIEGQGIAKMSEISELKITEIKQIDRDILIKAIPSIK